MSIIPEEVEIAARYNSRLMNENIIKPVVIKEEEQGFSCLAPYVVRSSLEKNYKIT